MNVLSFAEYLAGLDSNTSMEDPPESHRSGLGYIVWRLWCIMRQGSPETSQIAAAKELMDRAHGRSTQATTQVVPSAEVVLNSILWHKLDGPDEAANFKRALRKALPSEADLEDE